MSTTEPTLHDQFLSILPRIEGIAHFAFRSLPRDDREDAIAEVVGHAWRAFVKLVERGKNPLLFPTALARYSVMSIKSGKLIGCRCNRRDLVSPFRTKPKGFQVVSLESVSGPQAPPWREILTESRNVSPALTAAVRLDFAGWLHSLGRRDRRIAEALAQGHRTMDVARKFKISAGRISQIREEFRRSWCEFQQDPDLQANG